ncbi:MAG: nucleotide exchange factor GrpE [Pseudonocardiales bacterium]
MSGVADGVSSVPDEDVPDDGVPDEESSGGEAAAACGTAAELAPDPVADDPVAELVESVGELVEQVRAHHTRAQARERVIDQLHHEVERLRAGEQALFLRPVVTDLQRLRADLLDKAMKLPPRIDQEQVAALLESFALSVELALERCGSVPIRPSVGEEFSAREHRAVKLVAASSPAEDDTVAEVVADGYLDVSTSRVTVPARVHVRRWTPPDKTPPDETPPDETLRADDARLNERKEDNADV